MSINIYNKNGSLKDYQSIYDCYNDFIFSADRNIIYKLFTRFRLYEQIRNLHGDIVECGVFKGAGLTLWLKMIEMDTPNSIRKVIGFDYFDLSFVDKLQGVDKASMEQVFSRCDDLIPEEISVEGITEKLENANIDSSKYELVKGDLSVTSKEYVRTRPGFRISLLYLDVDLEEPTFKALEVMWERVVKGGIVVFDEYAYHAWSEANAVDKFVDKHGLKLIPINVKSPTAYVVK